MCLWWGGVGWGVNIVCVSGGVGGGVGDEREGVYGCRCGCVKEND